MSMQNVKAGKLIHYRLCPPQICWMVFPRSKMIHVSFVQQRDGRDPEILRDTDHPIQRFNCKSLSAPVVNLCKPDRSSILQVNPPASNMRFMTWDSTIAKMAQKKANKCIYDHANKLFHPTLGALGENIYITSGRLPSRSNFCLFRRLSELLQSTAWPHQISGQVLSNQLIVLSSRTVRRCSPLGGRWIGHWRTTWSTVYSSGPHSQAKEGAIPHWC